MRTLTTALLIGLVLFTLRACDGPSASPDPELLRARRFGAAALAIERLRAGDPPDWLAIQARYEEASSLVQAQRQVDEPPLDDLLRAALARGVKGEDRAVAEQTVAKGLQLAALRALRAELGALGRSAAADQRGQARAAAYFEALRPTVQRRDRDYSQGRPVLEGEADAALEALAQSAGSPAALAARRRLFDLLDRVYALSLRYEFEEIEARRDREPAICAAKLEEARFFLEANRRRMRRSSAAALQGLEGLIGGGCARVDAALGRRLIQEALPDLPGLGG